MLSWKLWWCWTNVSWWRWKLWYWRQSVWGWKPLFILHHKIQARFFPLTGVELQEMFDRPPFDPYEGQYQHSIEEIMK